MTARRIPVRRRAGLVALVLAGGWVLWWGAPRVLAGLEVFRLRRIELVGVRHLAPDAVIAALRLEPEASVFVDRDLLADRVAGLGGVVAARVERRFPGALTVVVREAEPVALVPGTRGLVAVDGRGRPLPFDPARSGLDLPIVAGADSGVAAVLALIHSVDPALSREIVTARATPPGDVVLDLESRRVVLGRDAGPEDIRAVVLVAQDLTARARRYGELDARFAGQVVVRRRASGTGGRGAGSGGPGE